MRRLALTTVVAALLGVALAGCEKEATPVADAPPAPSSVQSAAAAAYPKTDEGAKALLQALPKDAPLVLRLKPTTEDYKALFDAAAAAKAEQFYAASLWNGAAKVDINAGQTDLKVAKATSEELKSWSATAEANFPGGYQQVGPHLQPGFTWYRWKYTEPGKDTGMAYDGLVHVNGHWVWLPKPWRALES